MNSNKKKAPRNKTIVLTKEDKLRLHSNIINLSKPAVLNEVLFKTINNDIFDVIDFLPENSVDLLVTDPPYNLTKKFNLKTFKASDIDEYQIWLEKWLEKLPRILKPNASIYVCGDWRSSPCLFYSLGKFFKVRNRITWEREKGRGAKTNWKNAHEDIWFCTMSDNYTFNIDAVKVKKKVIAPYKDKNGNPKDWEETNEGKFRLSHPSNLWTDLTVPFWSMSENTEHPTQKPEKLIAKLILSSSNEGDVVFDPFLGSGTTSVVAKKLGRKFFGVELDELFSLTTEKRLELADANKSIQGYNDGNFEARNTLKTRKILTLKN